MTNSASYKSFFAGGSILIGTLAGCSSGHPEHEIGSVDAVQPLVARKALTKAAAPRRPTSKHRLIVKFTDELRMRALPTGAVRSEARSPGALSTASGISGLAQRFGLRFSPLLRLPEERLQSLQTRAALASKRVQPDLASIFVVDVADARMQDAADALHASPLTEFVYFQELMPPPPQACVDIAPATPSYAALQGYHGPNPGIDMAGAWALGAPRGAKVKIADCEYAYTLNHEDLCNVVMEPGQTPHPEIFVRGWEEHGTAVLGELISRDNGYGCTGLVPDADAYFFPEFTVEEGGRRATAIANAVSTLGAGDVVLLEMQAGGPVPDGWVPAEYDPAVWMVTKAGTDAGVVVVAAAGNGAQNLDDPMYADYMSRGDSGAIIVGAGTATTSHDTLWFSSYGSRVNVQAWGESVFSTGYGDFARHGGDENQSYTSGFGGTSSASPIVAAAAVAIQSFAQDFLERRLTPRELRSLLIETGTPQGAGGQIGPIPNVAAAIRRLQGGGEVRCGDGVCTSGSESCQSCPADCGACPSCVPAGCQSAAAVTLPYVRDGVQDACVLVNAASPQINSWNMSRVELNGVDVTNLWVSGSNLPPTCNGGYYLRGVGSFGWSHLEAR